MAVLYSFAMIKPSPGAMPSQPTRNVTSPLSLPLPRTHDSAPQVKTTGTPLFSLTCSVRNRTSHCAKFARTRGRGPLRWDKPGGSLGMAFSPGLLRICLRSSEGRDVTEGWWTWHKVCLGWSLLNAESLRAGATSRVEGVGPWLNPIENRPLPNHPETTAEASSLPPRRS